MRDVAGNPLAGDVGWSFTTVLADTTPPTVTGVTPADAAAGVSTATALTATFSEAINPATLTTTTFVLRNPANVLVSATVTYNAGTRVGNPYPTDRAGSIDDLHGDRITPAAPASGTAPAIRW